MVKESEKLKIKEIRKSLKLTQQQLADSIGVSKQYLSRVENGLTELSKEKITLLCNNYGISLDWLLSDFGQMFIQDKEVQSKHFTSVEDANEILLLINIYNLYLTAVYKIVKTKYPKATIEDKIQTAQILYMQDCISDKISYSKLEELKKRFEKETKNNEDFKVKVLSTYYFVYVQNKENSEK